MVFSSIPFLFLFLPLSLLLYFISPGIRAKNLILLILSLVFYAWGEAELVLLMILSSVFNYGIGICLERSQRKQLILGLGVLVNVLALVYYKYTGLILASVDSILGTTLNDGIDIKLPIGISFFTFQAISYIIDVYRGEAKAQKSLWDLMLYISLFPQLVAGPIVRYAGIAEALKKRSHSLEDFVAGSKRFVVGLAKKVLIANVMGELAEELFTVPMEEQYYAIVWFALFAYSLQIFFDFSGYSDMAIGLGRIFGFRFPENFLYPFISRSIREFWRRWHITLSTWFRDYLYIPLGGSRSSKARVYFNLLMVFFVTGLWHGATWNFVLWGLFHGLFILLERTGAIDRILNQPILSRVYTLLVVFLSWILFYMTDLESAGKLSLALFRLSGMEDGVHLNEILQLEYLLTAALGVALSMPLVPRIRVWMANHRNSKLQIPLAYTGNLLHLLIFCICIMYISSSTYNPFIYFRF